VNTASWESIARAVVGGLARRRVQTVVIGLVVLISTAAVLAAALLAESSAPFDRAFAARHGAQVTAAFDPAWASQAQLAATTRLPQVSAAAGPFTETTIGVSCTPVTVRLGGPNGIGLEQMTLAGRASPGGPVDDVALVSGHWVRNPGQVVLQWRQSWISSCACPDDPSLGALRRSSVSPPRDLWQDARPGEAGCGRGFARPGVVWAGQRTPQQIAGLMGLEGGQSGHGHRSRPGRPPGAAH
jgi:hypothetical protein